MEVLLETAGNSIVSGNGRKVRNIVLDRVKSGELASRFLQIFLANHELPRHCCSLSVAVTVSILVPRVNRRTKTTLADLMHNQIFSCTIEHSRLRFIGLSIYTIPIHLLLLAILFPLVSVTQSIRFSVRLGAIVSFFGLNVQTHEAV